MAFLGRVANSNLSYIFVLKLASSPEQSQKLTTSKPFYMYNFLQQRYGMLLLQQTSQTYITHEHNVFEIVGNPLENLTWQHHQPKSSQALPVNCLHSCPVPSTCTSATNTHITCIYTTDSIHTDRQQPEA